MCYPSFYHLEIIIIKKDRKFYSRYLLRTREIEAEGSNMSVEDPFFVVKG